jgi:hypothetical protein
MSNETTRPNLVTRRDAILRTGAALGGMTLVGQAAMLAGCERQQEQAPRPVDDVQGGLFGNREVEMLTELAETILPETGTPGAKAAGVGPFIALMVTDCYSPAEQETFRSGLASVDRESEQDYGGDFLALSPEQRLTIVERLDREQYDLAQSGSDDGPHYFRMIKELTVLGFFTSEIAYAQVLEYAETPGRYEPCRDLGPDTAVLADHGASVSRG